MAGLHQIRELPAVRRTQPITIGQNLSTTNVQVLQGLHGKQQQQAEIVACETLPERETEK